MQVFILDSHGNTLCSMSPDSNAKGIMNFFNDSWVQQSNIPETFEFEVLASDSKAENLKELNQVLFTHNNKTHMFTIIEVQTTHSDTQTVRCYCESVGLELLNSVVLPNTFASISAENALAYVLTDTDWKVGNVDYFPAHDIEFSSFGTVLSEVQNIATLYEGKLDYRVEYDSGKVTGKFIDLLENIGEDKGLRFEYGRNTSEVRKTVNASNIMTAIIPIGNNDITVASIACNKEEHGFTKPIGQYYIGLDELERSEIAAGANHIFGTIQIETDDPNELAIKGYEELQKQKHGQIEYEFNPVLLDDESVGLDDTVYCIDRELGDLQLSADVTELTISFSDSTQNKIVLANYQVIEETIADSLTRLQATLKNATLDNPMLKVSDKDPYEGTFDLAEGVLWVDTSQVSSGVIVLKEYSNGQWNKTIGFDSVQNLIDEKTEGIAGTLTNYIDNKVAGVTLTVPAGETAPELPNVGGMWMDTSKEPSILRRWNGTEWEPIGMDESTVEGLVNAYAGGLQGEVNTVKVKVEELEDSVSSKVSQTAYDTDKANNETRFEQNEAIILQTSNLINSKVDQTVYTADKTGMQNQINKNASDISQNATNISLKVEQSTYDTEITGIKNGMAVLTTNAETQSTQIELNKNNISLKANQADLDIISGKVNETEAQLIVHAEGISSKVSKGEVISSINQSAEEVTISADKINFNGAITQNDDGYTIEINDGAIHSRNADYSKTASLSGGFLSLHSTGSSAYLTDNCLLLRDDGSTESSIWHNLTTDGVTTDGMTISSPALKLNTASIDFNNALISNFKTPLSVTVTGAGNVVNGASYDATTQTLSLTKSMSFVTASNGKFYNQPVIQGDEEGYVGCGGMTTVTTNASNVAGYYCQFHLKHYAVPAAITLTATSSSGTNKATTDITNYGFWFYIMNTSGNSGYKYWRGKYQTS